LKKRLVAVAKELNVATGTIIERLSEGGFEVANSPRTTINDEMYALLRSEFAESIEIKEKADKIARQNRQNEVASKAATPAPAPKKATPKPEPIPEHTPEPKEAKVEATKEEVVKADSKPLAGPKVIGKIDLEPKKEAEPEPKAEEKPEPKVEAKEPEKVDEVIRAQKVTLSGTKVKGKIELKEIPKPDKEAKKKERAEQQKDRKRKRLRKKVRATGSGSRTEDRIAAKKREIEGDKSVSKKEIEERMKRTMAKMHGGGKNRRQKVRRGNREEKREKDVIQAEKEAQDAIVQVTEFISVSELASLLGTTATDIITKCFTVGVVVSVNQRLDAEIIELIAGEFEREIEFITPESETDMAIEEDDDDPDSLKPRAPIVTVMGHVDHGKTSLLDYIRDANVIDSEAGGITQHIGAYEVRVGPDKKKITFLDTPGHEAFTAMRARGAKVTDVAIIIVSADDAIMPQTKEAISHSEAAGVPMIFAINKIDKDGANPERIKEQLSAMNYLVEDWGGKYQSQDISAKEGTNIEELLEKVLLEAEMLELKANPDRSASGVVLEASLDKGKGHVAKMLVLRGTLEEGDAMVAGGASGKIKAMFNEHGKRIKEAGPSTPVMILGLDGAPQAGEKFRIMTNESEARQLASKRSQIDREQQQRATKRTSLEDIGRRIALGTFKELNVIVKGDVDGSIEALADSLQQLSVETIQVNIIHKAVGQIVENDVLLASASDAIIIGFQVRPSIAARQLAEKEGVQIKMYSVIYDAIDEVKAAMEGMLEPTKEEKVVSSVEVRDVFKISKIGTIAGSYVLEGKISRNNHIRLIRDGIVVYPTREGAHGEIASLKRFKDDVKEVTRGMECGISIKNFNDIKVSDIIEAYEIIEIKQTLS